MKFFVLVRQNAWHRMSERKTRGFKIHQREKSVFVGGSTRPALLCNSRSKQKLCLFTGQLHTADWSWRSVTDQHQSRLWFCSAEIPSGIKGWTHPAVSSPPFYNLLTSLNPPSLFCISLFLPSFVLSGCVSGSVSIHDSIMTNCSECELDFAPNKSLNRIKAFIPPFHFSTPSVYLMLFCLDCRSILTCFISLYCCFQPS